LIFSAKVTKDARVRLINKRKNNAMNEHIQQKSWFRRNWLWVVPVGGCLTIILIFIFGIGAAIFGVTQLFTESAPYTHALEQASNDSRVITLLGDRIESDGIMQGNISFKNNNGQANITIPIKGSKGLGSVTIIGEKEDGTWTYSTFFVTIKKTKQKVLEYRSCFLMVLRKHLLS